MIQELLLEIQNTQSFDFNETFNIYKRCSELIIENEESAQKVIVNILEDKQKFDQTLNNVLTDLIEAIGFYPYLKKKIYN